VGLPHTRWRCDVGASCTVEAIFNGESDPRDDIADLGGRPFSSWWVEWPAPLVTLTHDAATATISFTPATAGHHLLAVSRPSGGIALCHFDAEDP
jgi:hypothetical protein